MGVVIDDPQTEAKIRELAARTGETPEQAVAHAVDARRAQLPAPKPPPGGAESRPRERTLEEVLAHIDSLPVVDDRSPDEIIGYDENGLPR